MSASLDLERRLAIWLEQDGPADVSATAVEAALAQARTIRQQRAWLTRTWWDRRPFVAAPARVEAGAIEPGERIPTFPVARPPLRRAWAMLLLAGLLVALVGGTLLVGSQLQRWLPAVVPPVGQVYECPPGSNPDKPGPVDQARPAEEWSATAFDRRAGRLVVVTISGKGVETWTFDVCTNTWMEMHPNRQPPRYGWGRLVYDVDSDITILVSSAMPLDGIPAHLAVWAYDLQADTWTEKAAAPTDYTVSLAYDPDSGLVVAADHAAFRQLMWTYEVATDTWTRIPEANEGPLRTEIAYDTSLDRLVAHGDGGGFEQVEQYETWLFDIRSGTWSRSAAERPAVNVECWCSPGLVYDEAAERTLIFKRSPLTAYDASADRWEILAAPELPWEDAPSVYVYDAVNRRLVGWRVGGNTNQETAVVAFDLTTHEWTVLLEPSGRSSSTPVPRPEPTSARTATPPGGTEETGPTSTMPTASSTSTP